MTVTANRETRVITSNTGFANPIELDQYVEQTGHIKVYADTLLLTPGVDYTIDTALPADGIEISITATGLLYDPVDWIVLHDPPMDQEADLSLGGRFGLAYEQTVDALARRLQAMNDKVSRGLRLPVNTPLNVEGGEFPSPEPDNIVGWNASATALENKGTVPQLTTIAAIAAQITAVSAKLDEIEAVANNQANIAALNAQITSLGAIATELAELALVESELLDLHGKLTMLTALYGSLTQLLAVHSQLADIAAVAGIDGEITALASLAATELPAIYAALGDIHAAVADLPSLAAKLNKDASNVGGSAATALANLGGVAKTGDTMTGLLRFALGIGDGGKGIVVSGAGTYGAGDESDPDGLLIALAHNQSGVNRQLFFGNSETLDGIRVLGNGIDGYNLGTASRKTLNLGTVTHGVHLVGSSTAAGRFTLKSTSDGLVLSRLTTTQRDAISAPVKGLVIYNTDVDDLQVYDGAAWLPVLSVGSGQTWQDVTGSRSKETTYTNNTGRPIAVSILLSSTDYPGWVTLEVGGLALISGVLTSQISTYLGTTIVPPGASYKVSGGGAAVPSMWAELR